MVDNEKELNINPEDFEPNTEVDLDIEEEIYKLLLLKEQTPVKGIFSDQENSKLEKFKVEYIGEYKNAEKRIAFEKLPRAEQNIVERHLDNIKVENRYREFMKKTHGIEVKQKNTPPIGEFNKRMK